MEYILFGQFHDYLLLPSYYQAVSGQALQGSNIGARSFATKHSFSTDKGMI